MPYFYVKRKSERSEEKVGNYIFTEGVLFVENEDEARKMSNNLSKYYGVKMSDKSPEELKSGKDTEE
jgi:hypothetical protein